MLTKPPPKTCTLLNWINWNRTNCLKMDLALNDLKGLICHTNQTNQSLTNHTCIINQLCANKSALVGLKILSTNYAFTNYIYIKQDLALNNLQGVICHKTQQTTTTYKLFLPKSYIFNIQGVSKYMQLINTIMIWRSFGMRSVKNSSYETFYFNCYYISFQDMQSFFWVSCLCNKSLSH